MQPITRRGGRSEPPPIREDVRANDQAEGADEDGTKYQQRHASVPIEHLVGERYTSRT
jgi:hypothetical protein